MARSLLERKLYALIAALSMLILIFYVRDRGGASAGRKMKVFHKSILDQLMSTTPKLLTTKHITPECACLNSNGQIYNFCYTLPENRSIHGQRFSCEYLPRLEKLGLLETSHLSFAASAFPTAPTFVTGFSANHEIEARQLINSIKKTFGNRRLIVYDLGDVNLSSFKKWKFLEFRSFNFSEYPEYVRNLHEFRWKPIIIAETLKEFGAIWYMDSSVVFKKSDLSHVYELIRCRSHVSVRPPLKSTTQRDLRESRTAHENGWNVEQWKENVAECRKAAYLMHGYTGHGIYTATSPEVYKFIPTNFTEIKKPKAKMYEAGFVFVVRTKDTIEEILKWYVLCALEKDCMAGSGREELGCRFGHDRFSDPPTCHRFDQSIVNLLAANAFWYDRHYYVSEIVDFFNIIRMRK